MTITFECNHTGKIIKVKNVKNFKTDQTCFDITGYWVNYEDGTFNLYSYNSWKLVMVEQ